MRAAWPAGAGGAAHTRGPRAVRAAWPAGAGGAARARGPRAVRAAAAVAVSICAFTCLTGIYQV